jgi:hypothetical protein
LLLTSSYMPGRCRCLPRPRLWKGVGGKRHNPAPLPPGKTWYSLHSALGGPRVRSKQVRKISPPMWF